MIPYMHYMFFFFMLLVSFSSCMFWSAGNGWSSGCHWSPRREGIPLRTPFVCKSYPASADGVLKYSLQSWKVNNYALLSFVSQGPTGKPGLPGMPGADGPPVSSIITNSMQLTVSHTSRSVWDHAVYSNVLPSCRVTQERKDQGEPKEIRLVCGADTLQWLSKTC